MIDIVLALKNFERRALPTRLFWCAWLLIHFCWSLICFCYMQLLKLWLSTERALTLTAFHTMRAFHTLRTLHTLRTFNTLRPPHSRENCPRILPRQPQPWRTRQVTGKGIQIHSIPGVGESLLPSNMVTLIPWYLNGKLLLLFSIVCCNSRHLNTARDLSLDTLNILSLYDVWTPW